MALLKEIVFDIKNIIHGGVLADEEMISDRQVEFQVHTLRAQFIRQDINKRRSISDNIKQLIYCLEMELVSGDTCGLSDDVMVMRSKEKIPSSVETAHQNLVTAIGPTGILSSNFHLIPYNRAPWAGNNRYTKRMTFAFLLDGFVYILGPDAEEVENIRVEGVWQDPTRIGEYKKPDGSLCYDVDKDEYPLSTSMLDLIKQAMFAQNIQPMIQLPAGGSTPQSEQYNPQR